MNCFILFDGENSWRKQDYCPLPGYNSRKCKKDHEDKRRADTDLHRRKREDNDYD